MMLHSIAKEDFGSAVITVNRERDGYGALGEFDAVAVRKGDLQIIGNFIELLASHVESRMVVHLHGRKASKPPRF